MIRTYVPGKYIHTYTWYQYYIYQVRSTRYVSIEKLKNVSCEYDRWVIETQLASCVIRQTRSLGALVLYSICMQGCTFRQTCGNCYEKLRKISFSCYVRLLRQKTGMKSNIPVSNGRGIRKGDARIGAGLEGSFFSF